MVFRRHPNTFDRIEFTIVDTIKSLISDKFIIFSKNTSFREAVRIMNDGDSKCAVIVEGKIPVGIISERDIIRILSGDIDIANLTVGDTTTEPVHTIHDDIAISDAIKIIKDKDVSCLVVVNLNDEISGLITEIDVIRGYTENLEKLVKKNRMAFDNLPEGVCEYDMEKSIIAWINKAGAGMFGYESPEDMIGKDMTDIFVDIDDKKKLMDILYKEGVARNFVFRAKKIDNSIFYLEGTYNLRKDESEEKHKIEGIIRDVTDRKVDEYRAVNKERLEAILQVVRTARHEINNPLTGILGNIELLMDKGSKLNKNVQKKLKVIYEQSMRIKDIVQNMSTISRAIERENISKINIKMIDLEKSKGK